MLLRKTTSTSSSVLTGDKIPNGRSHLENKPPNIILVITDQQRFDTIAALGFPYMETPNLDRLVNEGVSFTNCFVPAPSCAPARASLFTGYYPHNTKIFKNGDSWQRTWVSKLSDAGYHTVNIGKMHTTPFDSDKTGFNERFVVENKDRFLQGAEFLDEWDKALMAHGLDKPGRTKYRTRKDYRNSLGAFLWDLPEHLHSDMFVGDMAIRWIDRYPANNPFFLQIGFPGPHPPYDPIPRWANRYKDVDLDIAHVSTQDLESQPPPFGFMRTHNVEVDHDSIVHQLDPTDSQRQQQREYYLANVSMIDEKMGQIMQALEQRGHLDNSVVIFTSDHGDCLTDHGHSQKWTMYDTVTRVPVIAWSPTNRFLRGATIDDLYSWIDLGPTILELAGIDSPKGFDAISALPAMKGEKTQGRKYVFSEHIRENMMGLDTDFMTMVRDRKWKLVHFAGESFGQLFDLEADPDENINLWNEPDYQVAKHSMLETLREWLISSNARANDWGSDWR